ncbi:MAG: hypothetical protein SF123_18995 [Chloroflexota bacterium]|nr:hypothetical protein [Chloroflexota bacterium]
MSGAIAQVRAVSSKVYAPEVDLTTAERATVETETDMMKPLSLREKGSESETAGKRMDRGVA